MHRTTILYVNVSGLKNNRGFVAAAIWCTLREEKTEQETCPSLLSKDFKGRSEEQDGDIQVTTGLGVQRPYEQQDRLIEQLEACWNEEEMELVQRKCVGMPSSLSTQSFSEFSPEVGAIKRRSINHYYSAALAPLVST